jgi:hypothetical protein
MQQFLRRPQDVTRQVPQERKFFFADFPMFSSFPKHFPPLIAVI